MNPQTTPNPENEEAPQNASSAEKTVNTESIAPPNPQPAVYGTTTTAPPNAVTSQEPLPTVRNKRIGFKNLKLVLLLILVLIAGVVIGIVLINKSKSPSGWVSYSNQQDNFSAVFPAYPKTTKPYTATESGTTYNVVAFGTGNSQRVYLITRQTSANGAATLPPLSLFAQTSNYGKGAQNLRIISSENLTVDGYRAERIQFSGVIQ